MTRQSSTLPRVVAAVTYSALLIVCRPYTLLDGVSLQVHYYHRRPLGETSSKDGAKKRVDTIWTSIRCRTDATITLCQNMSNGLLERFQDSPRRVICSSTTARR
jgi:hypothetical protein